MDILLYWIVFLLALIIACGYMWARNDWVYKQRMIMLDISMAEYRKLPSYNDMYWRVFCWDINKFKNRVD